MKSFDPIVGFIVFVGMFGLCLNCLFLVEDVTYNEPILTGVNDYYIKSLHDGTQNVGIFTLGTGQFSNQPQFIYYQFEGKGYKLKSCPAEYTTVIEGENNNPYIRIKEISEQGIVSQQIYQTYMIYELHVPNGTITKEWKLDGELRGG